MSALEASLLVLLTSALAHKTDLEAIRKGVDDSIAKLGFIPDLILIHSPNVVEDGNIGQFWQHLESLVEDGTLKGTSLGFSNFRPQDIEAVMKVAKIKPVCNREWPGP